MIEKEKAYAFRQALDEVHKRDRRDPLAKAAAHEAVVDLDWSIAIAPANDRLLEYAAFASGSRRSLLCTSSSACRKA